jgi:hypothetical protein
MRADHGARLERPDLGQHSVVEDVAHNVDTIGRLQIDVKDFDAARFQRSEDQLMDVRLLDLAEVASG